MNDKPPPAEITFLLLVFVLFAVVVAFILVGLLAPHSSSTCLSFHFASYGIAICH